MNFPEFIRAYSDGTIHNDATWRAYDIPAMAEVSSRAKEGLKALGMRPGDGVIAYNQVAADYGLDTSFRARHMLALWRAWLRVAHGRAKRGLIPREGSTDNGN
jgi:hypothetical protein